MKDRRNLFSRLFPMRGPQAKHVIKCSAEEHFFARHRNKFAGVPTPCLFSCSRVQKKAGPQKCCFSLHLRILLRGAKNAALEGMYRGRLRRPDSFGAWFRCEHCRSAPGVVNHVPRSECMSLKNMRCVPRQGADPSTCVVCVRNIVSETHRSERRGERDRADLHLRGSLRVVEEICGRTHR